jgi:hypothetical protein
VRGSWLGGRLIGADRVVAGVMRSAVRVGRVRVAKAARRVRLEGGSVHVPPPVLDCVYWGGGGDMGCPGWRVSGGRAGGSVGGPLRCGLAVLKALNSPIGRGVWRWPEAMWCRSATSASLSGWWCWVGEGPPAAAPWGECTSLFFVVPPALVLVGETVHRARERRRRNITPREWRLAYCKYFVALMQPEGGCWICFLTFVMN